MIKIQASRDKNGFIWNISVRGHSGLAQHGNDIVCAGVSALAYTAVGALEELAGIKEVVEKDGYMEWSVPTDVKTNLKPHISIIMETIFIGLKQIENEYGEYVVIKEKEV